MDARRAPAFATLCWLAVSVRAWCAGTAAPSDVKPIQAQDYLLLAEKYVKAGSSSNEMSQYQSAGNVLGGKNFSLARRYFRIANQKLERKAGHQLLGRQPLPERRLTARVFSEQGWFFYQTSAGSDRTAAARLVSRAAVLDPDNATAQFKVAAIEVDRYEEGGEKDKGLLRDVETHLQRAIQLGPDEAAPSFWMMASLTAGRGHQLPRVGEDYAKFLEHAPGLNPEIYLYNIGEVEERFQAARHFAQIFAPSLLRRLGPKVTTNALSKVKASIAKRGWPSSRPEPEPTVPPISSTGT